MDEERLQARAGRLSVTCRRNQEIRSANRRHGTARLSLSHRRRTRHLLLLKSVSAAGSIFLTGTCNISVAFETPSVPSHWQYRFWVARRSRHHPLAALPPQPDPSSVKQPLRDLHFLPNKRDHVQRRQHDCKIKRHREDLVYAPGAYVENKSSNLAAPFAIGASGVFYSRFAAPTLGA